MSKLRQEWRNYKTAFETHLAPLFGRNWTETFSQGLGPALDDFTKKFEDMAATFSAASQFASEADRKKTLTLYNEAQARYGKVVKKAKDVVAAGEKVKKKIVDYQATIQRKATEAGRKAPISDLVAANIRKAVGSLNVLRDIVQHYVAEASNRYGHNAEHHQKTYLKLFKESGKKVGNPR